MRGRILYHLYIDLSLLPILLIEHIDRQQRKIRPHMYIICINRDTFLYIAAHRIIQFIWFSLIPMPFLSFLYIYIYNLPLFIEFILLFFICLWHPFSFSFVLLYILPPAHFCLFIFFNIDYTNRQLKKYVPSNTIIEVKQICTYSSLLPPSFLVLFFSSFY